MKALVAWIAIVTGVFIIAAPRVARELLQDGWSRGVGVALIAIAFMAAIIVGCIVYASIVHGQEAIPKAAMVGAGVAAWLIATWFVKMGFHALFRKLELAPDLRFHGAWAATLLLMVLPVVIWARHFETQE